MKKVVRSFIRIAEAAIELLTLFGIALTLVLLLPSLILFLLAVLLLVLIRERIENWLAE